MVEASYALYDTDFEALAQAMTSVPSIQRKVIENIADMAWLAVLDNKEKRFWRAISHGCRFD